MRTIVITNQKGGCGKTTTAVNLAAALAQQGKRVLLIDLDPQAHATLGLGHHPEALQRTVLHSLGNQRVPLSKVTVATKIKGLDLAPSSAALSRAELEPGAMPREEFTLREQLKGVSNKYDICVVDCPPSLGPLTLNALIASTDVIVPVQVHYYALEGLKKLLQTIKTTRKLFPACAVKILGLLLTFVETKVVLSQQVERQMREYFGDLVFDTVIHSTISLAEAPSAGEPIVTYAPQSQGAAEYRALAEEVTNPKYKRKRKLPEEVSAIVEEIEPEEEAEAEEVAVAEEEMPEEELEEERLEEKEEEEVVKEEKEAVLKPAVAPEAPEPVSRRRVKSRLSLLSVLAVILVVVVIVLLIVVGVTNTPPVAISGSATTQEDTSVLVTLAGGDSDEDQLTYRVATGPSHGTLSGIAPNLVYTPAPDYNGRDSFTFTVNDGTIDSYPATVAITVTPTNDAPKAKSRSAVTQINKSASITLAADDVDGDALVFTIFRRPEHGTLIPGPDFETSGELVYKPEPGFTGSDSFAFRSHDGTEESDTATVAIDVTPNHPPVADLQRVITTEDSSVAIDLMGSDPDGDQLVYTLVTRPQNGSLSGTEPNLIYTPNTDFHGSDSFTFKVNDGMADSMLATVSITVTPANDQPVANDLSVMASEDISERVVLTGSDPEGDVLTYIVVEWPSSGTLDGTAPNLTYIPNENFDGSDSFTFKVNDGQMDSPPATVSITVKPMADQPVANSGAITIQEDTPGQIALTGSDPDGDPLTYSIVTGPSRGTLSGEAPDLTYTPNANFSGSDGFTFRVSDGVTGSAPATISITVTGMNDPPVASDSSVTAEEDTPASITLMSSDPDGDTLTYRVVASPTHGTLSGEAPNLTYMPHRDFAGTDSFSFKVGDGTYESAVATVSITVTPLNDAPVADFERVTTQEDTPVRIPLTASDPDGDSLTYSVVREPAHGRLTGTEPNVTYLPDADFNGNDSFIFKVNDGLLDSVLATVTIQVTAVNDSPAAHADSVTTQEETAVSVALSGSDIDGDLLTYSVVEEPSHGSLSGAEPNLVYTPHTNFNGTDRFTFKATDGKLDSAPAAVSVTVTPVDDAPTAHAQSVTTQEEVAVSVILSGSDVDGDPLTYSTVTGPSYGRLGGTEPNLVYTPSTNFNGSDSFTFKANDGKLDSAPATVSIRVTPINDRPIANAATAMTQEDTPASITLSGGDVDGDPLTYSVVEEPSYGSLSGAAPKLTYKPNPDFSGSDRFTFKANDGSLDSEPAVVLIAITPVEDPPTAHACSVTAQEDTAVPVNLTASDPDGDLLTYSVATGPSHGSLSGAEPKLVYTPNANYHGSDSFTFRASDGRAESVPATVSITVASVEDWPIANSDSVTTLEDTPVPIILLASDPDGDELTYSIVASPSHGRLSGSEPNLTYTPDPNFHGSDSFTFKVNDGTANSIPAAVSINVIAVNDMPIANSDSVKTQEDTPVSIFLVGSDPDKDPLTFSVVTAPSHGKLSGLAPDLTYKPNPDFHGSDNFTFKVSDGKADGVPAVVSITVIAVNDPPTVRSDSVTTEEDAPVSIPLMASDPDGYDLTYSVVTEPSHGKLSGTAPNLIYTPNSDFNGLDSFSFKASDGTTDSVPATVSITVTPVNDPPVAEPDSATIDEDTPMWIGLKGSDPDGDALGYRVIKDPSHGRLSGTVPNLTYTPNENFNGSDSFVFVVNDGIEDSAPATVSIKVTPANDLPRVSDDSVTTREDVPLQISLRGVDPDGDPLTYTVVTGPSHGSLSGAPPTLLYVPNKDFCGADALTFKVNDGKVDSVLATVGITIVPVNDVPTASGDSVTTREDIPVPIGLKGMDPDGYLLTYRLVTGPSYGSLSGVAPNLTYTPNANFSGSDSFTFKVSDGTAESVPVTISIVVTPVDDQPVAVGGSATTQQAAPVWITLNASDPDGDPLTYTIVTSPSHGSLRGTPPTLVYTPNTYFRGSDGFTFKVNDGSADSSPATFSITVTSVDRTPAASSDNVTLQQGKSIAITLVGSDPEGDLLTYIIVEGPFHGSLSGTPPRMTYTPSTNFSGSDRFIFKVNDGTTDSALATVSITVTPRGDVPIAKRDNATTQEGMPITIDVLANDTKVGNEPLTVIAVTQGVHGSVAINVNNTLTYTPGASFQGLDTFTYTLSDGKGGSDTATVNVTVQRANDAPRFTSAPVTTAMVGMPYAYDANATDSDAGDTLSYSLMAKPAGMTIRPDTGSIRWTPTDAQVGSNEVIVKVIDSNSSPASSTQAFTVRVRPVPPRVVDLIVVNGYDQKKRRTLSADGKTDVVRSSDNDRLETEPRSYTSFDFSDVSLPEGAVITSVVVYVEHFEEEQIPSGKLRWNVGTGWPVNPTVWASTNAPVRAGQQSELVDSWDVTTYVDTVEKINSLQLRIENNDDVTRAKTLADRVYAVVAWNWPARRQDAVELEVEYDFDDELVPVR